MQDTSGEGYVQFWVGVTDGDWYDFLAARRPEEVNFWQPGERAARTMTPGWPFLFKLHSPKNFVVGGGYFVRYTQLPCFLAWEAFRENKGVRSLGELVERTAHYRKAPQTPGTVIGCNVLAEPFFFPQKYWIPIPPDWARNIVSGKTYDSTEGHGAALWNIVLRNLQKQDSRGPRSEARREQPAAGGIRERPGVLPVSRGAVGEVFRSSRDTCRLWFSSRRTTDLSD